jgi:hypothetical protein
MVRRDSAGMLSAQLIVSVPVTAQRAAVQLVLVAVRMTRDTRIRHSRVILILSSVSADCYRRCYKSTNKEKLHAGLCAGEQRNQTEEKR